MQSSAVALSTRHHLASLFTVSLAGLYFTAINITTVKTQVHMQGAPWAPIMAALFCFTPPLLTVLSGAAWLADIRQPASRFSHAARRLANAGCWWGASLTIVTTLVPLVLHLATGIALFRISPNAEIPLPFPALTFVISLLYALALGFRHMLALILVQCATTAALSSSVGNPPAMVVTDFVYAFVFSSLIVGGIALLLRGVGELEQSAATTIRERATAFELEAQLDENARVNALLHDYVIAVTVVVGRGLHVTGEALVAAARSALQVLDHLLHAASLTDLQLAPLELERVSTELPRRHRQQLELPLTDGHHLTLPAWIRLARTIAKAEGFTVATRGLVTWLALSRKKPLTETIFRLPPLVVPAEVAIAALEAMMEAMRNTRRYANASERTVQIRAHLWGRAQLIVHVDDDGAGFDAQPANFGFGLRHSIIERMQQVGGSAMIASAPKAGCSVRLVLPLRRSEQLEGAPIATTGRFSTRGRRPLDEFFQSAQTPTSRFVFALLLPMVWVHVIFALPFVSHPWVMNMIGIALSVLYVRISFAPESTPPWTYHLAALTSSAVLPVMALAIIPPYPHPATLTFVFPLLVIVHLWLWVRGAYGTAIVSFCFTATSFVAGSYSYGFQSPMPWDIVVRNLGTVLGFVLYMLGLARTYRRLQSEAQSQEVLRAMQASRKRVLAARKARVAEIDAEVRPLLEAITAGVDPASLREAATVTEAQLRDAIRADRLAVSPLREAVAAARMRGVNVRLADDSGGKRDLGKLIEAATCAVASALAGEAVTVRALPPTHHQVGTVLIADRDGETRLLRI